MADTENVAEIPTSFGGLLFMMAAVIYLGGVVVLEAWPVYLFLDSRFRGGEAQVYIVPLVLGVAGAAALHGHARKPGVGRLDDRTDSEVAVDEACAEELGDRQLRI